jgi:hypothetical protein
MKQKARGFTLMELMFASFIILALYINCINLSELAKNTTIAINAAQAKIEEIRNYPFDTITVYGPGGSKGNAFTIPNWLSSSNHQGAIERTELVATQLYEFRVTVSWRERSGRIIGEDKNFDGDCQDSGEDTSPANGQCDSPAKVVTLISRRP